MYISSEFVTQKQPHPIPNTLICKAIAGPDEKTDLSTLLRYIRNKSSFNVNYGVMVSVPACKAIKPVKSLVAWIVLNMSKVLFY